MAVSSMLERALTGDSPRSGDSDGTDALAVLADFRAEWFVCLTGRGEELFELTDAVLCADGSVKTLVGLALAPAHRREHGALYDGLNHGQLNIVRGSRRTARAGGRRLTLATPRCRHRTEALVLPHLWPGQERAPDDPGLAILDRGRAGARPHLLDRPAGRAPPGAGHRCLGDHRRPAAPGRPAADRGRTVAGRGPADPPRGRCRLRPASVVVPAGRSRCWAGCARTG